MLTALAHLILACSRSRSIVADSMSDHPTDWKLDSGEFCLVHKTGIEVLVSNGFWFVDLYPKKAPFNLAEKWIVWRAARRILKAEQRRVRRIAQKELREKLSVLKEDR